MMNLGELIAALKRKDQSTFVSYDFASFAPTTLDSYRGYYDQLALGHSNFPEPSFDGEYWPTVAALVAELEKALQPGKRYTGWKGGEYQMSESTTVWVANPGHVGSTTIADVIEFQSFITIKTELWGN